MIGSTLRKVLIGVAVVAVAAGVAMGPSLVSRIAKAKTGPELATAAHRSFPVVATASGSLVPAAQKTLDFGVSGQIREIDVSVGQQVSAGQVIARLDDASQQASMAAAQSALSAAEQSLTAASTPDATRLQALQSALSTAQQLEQNASVHAQGVMQRDQQNVNADQQMINADQQTLQADGCQASPPPDQCSRDQAALAQDSLRLQHDQDQLRSDLISGQAQISAARNQAVAAQSNLSQATQPSTLQIANAEAQVANAHAQLQRAQADDAKTILTAPIAGTVLALNAQVGESVNAGSTGSPSLPGSTGPLPQNGNSAAAHRGLVVLGNDTDFQVAAGFSEADASRIAAGQTGAVSIDAVSGLSLPCHIIAVDGGATQVNGVSLFYATVSPDRRDPRLRAGMSATVRIDVAHAANVLAVPNQALYMLDDHLHVDVWYQGRSVPTSVTTGLIGDTLSEVTSGLSDGAQVVLSAQHGLPPSAVPSPSRAP